MANIVTIAYMCEVEKLYYIKGIDFIEKIATGLKEHTFYIFGNTKEVTSINSNVLFCGFLDHAELLNRMTEFDFYFQPSRSESFGMAVLEAMHQGLTPIVSNKGALPEIVGDTGIVFDLSIQEALKALKNPVKTDILLLKERTNKFSYDNRRKKIHAIINELF
ncbi:glycosyltransferase family 4 protein [Methanolobus vulcani]|jgi:Glycosyltransferase|uniref:glycosyltransferase family 4 protein n=1 Tax=Methanolobus vulcani TaxID=38026 RepID=UPI000B88BA06|nr:glycosyltransferase family 4 protein [Methanolobus vulcani]